MTNLDMTKQEYLASLQKQANETLALYTQGGLQKKILSFVSLCVAVLLVSMGGVFLTSRANNKAYNEYMQGGTVSFTVLNHKDAFSRWNKTELGNNANTLLSGGKLLIKDGLKISGVPLTGNTDGFLFLSNASYLNKINNQVIYRDDTNHHLYSFNPSSNQKTLFYEGNVGEVLGYGSELYFIDYNKQGGISCLNINNTKSISAVVEQPVVAFIICGKQILYLDAQQSLHLKTIGTNMEETIAQSVERFFLNGEIVVQSKNNLIAFSPSGKNSRLLYTSAVDNLQLAGVLGKKLYLQEEGILYSWENGKKTKLMQEKYNMFTSVSQDAEGPLFAVANKLGPDKLLGKMVKLTEKGE